MAAEKLLSVFGDEIEDPEEDTFVLFSQSVPSQNLGFVDPKVPVLDITVAGRDLTIRQSPTVLSSNRAGGTTGAVLWKITPLFAEWIASSENILFTSGMLTEEAAVIELGCGISGLVGLVLAPRISTYILTDQAYVSRFVEQNLRDNRTESPNLRTARSQKAKSASTPGSHGPTVVFKPLDWEVDQATPALTGSPDHQYFDAVIACDCIYNEALIQPLVQTCLDICRLKSVDETCSKSNTCLCIVAQQLRNSDVFEAWLKAFHADFRVWQIPDTLLIPGLQSGSGFVVHVGIARN